MKKLLMLIAGAGFMLANVACSSPCDDLVCGNCDPNSAGLQSACQVIVDADDSDACDIALDLATYDSCR